MGRDLQRQMKPPPWRQTWPPILAGLLWSVAIVLGTAWLLHEPPTPPPENPLVLNTTRSMFIERDGSEVWRVEMTVDVRHSCGSVVVDRRFAPSGGDVRSHEPLYSYIDELGLRLGTAPYSVTVDAEQTPVLNVWHEYEIVPGERGNLLVDVEAYDCANGFAGPTVVGKAVPYDWTGR